MRRTAAFIVLALVLLAPAGTAAKGGYARPPETKFYTAGVPSPEQLSPGTILGGCGPKRIRDPTTNKCRGPADVGN